MILAAVEESAKLPTARTEVFWKKWAAQFKDNPNVLFDLFDDPQADAIPGHRPGIRTDAEWQIWQQSMQRIVDSIRSTGAKQVITAMAFDDDLLLQGFSDRWLLRDSNVIYEVCPNNRVHSTDSARDRDFGLLAARIPIMAMDWDPQLDQDNAECRSMPRDPKSAAAAIGSHMKYFDTHNISWLASSFTPKPRAPLP